MTVTKNRVLATFEKYKGEVISGIELSEQLGVTRTAIWKAINNLRDEGYDIESIKKRGYRLNVNSDILSAIKLKENLEGDYYDLRLFKSVDSTNKVARLMAIQEEKEWIVIASEMQESGKGRDRTIFLSPEGKGIYMSVILRPHVDMDYRKELMLLSREAVKLGIKGCTGVDVEVQLAGDILYDGKKIGGILTEAQVELETEVIESIVVGIGIHIYRGDERDEETISLSELIGRYCNRSELIAAILNVLYKNYIGWIRKLEMKGDLINE